MTSPKAIELAKLAFPDMWAPYAELLDRTLEALAYRHKSNAAACARVASIAELICRAAYEVGMTLPAEQRACSR